MSGIGDMCEITQLGLKPPNTTCWAGYATNYGPAKSGGVSVNLVARKFFSAQEHFQPKSSTYESHEGRIITNIS